MNKSKLKRYAFISLIVILILFFVFVIMYKIYYPDKVITFQVRQTINDGSFYQEYSVLEDKESQELIGIGYFVPPDDLQVVISQKEHFELLNYGRYKIYNDIHLNVNNIPVHIQVIEKRRLFIEKVYHANISVFYQGYYIQTSFYFPPDLESIDFTNEQEVSKVAKDICIEIQDKYFEHIQQVDQYLKS